MNKNKHIQITHHRGKSRGAHVSSIVNEVIKGNLKPFYLFIFFYEKISHAQKAKNTYKRTKTKKTDLLCA